MHCEKNTPFTLIATEQKVLTDWRERKDKRYVLYFHYVSETSSGYLQTRSTPGNVTK